MAEHSGIEWTDSTVNFWWGCTKVGPGCDHCYAETWSKRTGENIWGVGAPRRKIKGAVALLHKLDNGYSWWAADHEIAGHHSTRRRRVFIQSMSDLFDLEVPAEWFAEAWQTIERCSRLNIQIVTKRISAVEKRLTALGVTTWPRHVGLMITVCNQAEADRDIPRLLALKAKLGIPWVGLSIEPLLGPVDLERVSVPHPTYEQVDANLNALIGETFDLGDASLSRHPNLDHVIVGGESGPHARAMHPGWVRSLRDQCAAADVPFFFKQWGEWAAIEKWRPYQGAARQIAITSMGLDVDDMADEFPSGAQRFERLGKKAACRLLDGVEHNAMPRAFE